MLVPILICHLHCNANAYSGQTGRSGQWEILADVSRKIEVTECKRTDDGGAIWSGDITGSFPTKQTSRYVAKDGGTELTFDIDSVPPETLFTKILDKLVTDKMEENSTQHTLENIKAICES